MLVNGTHINELDFKNQNEYESSDNCTNGRQVITFWFVVNNMNLNTVKGGVQCDCNGHRGTMIGFLNVTYDNVRGILPEPSTPPSECPTTTLDQCVQQYNLTCSGAAKQTISFLLILFTSSFFHIMFHPC